MTAALLAAVLTLSAAQGLVASEDSEQVQEQAEPAAKQSEQKQPESKPAETPAPQAEAAKQPEQKQPEPKPAETPAPQTEAEKHAEQADTPAPSDPPQTEAAAEPAGNQTQEQPETGNPQTEATGSGTSETENANPDDLEAETADPEETPEPAETEPTDTGMEETEPEIPEIGDFVEELEAADENDADLGLKNISIADDSRGTYIEYEFSNTKELSTKLTFSLVDSGGNVTGSSYSETTSEKKNARIYIIDLDRNLFSLTASDMKKTVSVRVTAKNSEGSQSVGSTGSVKLRLPAISMPAVISYGVVTKPDDMYDVTKVSGVSFDTGSCVTQRILEKISDAGITQIPPEQTLTGDDAGVYQFRIRSYFGDIVSNQFLFTVPATGLSVDGDIRIGSEIKAVPEGVNGYAPTELTYEWSFPGSAQPVCTGAVCTPTLKEAVEAQTLSLTLTIRDAVGNVFDNAMELAPMDLSAANLTTGASGLTYTGISQIPADAGVFVGGYRIPESLYTLAPAPGKNTTDAGTAWMQVSGENAYLTNSGIVAYEIAQASAGLDREDFVLSFAYDGSAHRPVLKADAQPETKVRLVYRKWKRRSGSGWASMNRAPVQPGTYRVDVIVIPKDANYGRAVLKRMEFRITGEAKTLQDAKPDLTVTDRYGNPAAYSVQVIVPGGQEQEKAAVYQICAALDKEAADQDQTSVQEQRQSTMRCLNITGELLGKAEAAGCKMLQFVLGGAAVEMEAAALKQGAPYRLELASVREEELRVEEKKTLSDYETVGGMYAVRLSSAPDSSGQASMVEETVTLTAYLEVLPEDRDQIKGCLFLAEEDPDKPAGREPLLVTGSLSESEDSILYSAELDPAGVFCLVRDTGFER